jgi:hypothetical protein
LDQFSADPLPLSMTIFESFRAAAAQQKTDQQHFPLHAPNHSLFKPFLETSLKRSLGISFFFEKERKGLCL